jgi:subtilisin family serine protease
MRDEYRKIFLKSTFFQYQLIKKIISICICVLLSTTFLSTPAAVTTANETFPVLIEFTKPGYINYLTTVLNTSIFNYDSENILKNISNFQQYALNKIESLLGLSYSNSTVKHYRFLLNGLRISSLSKSQIHKIEQLSFIKHIEKDTHIRLSSHTSSNLSIHTTQHTLLPSQHSTPISEYSGRNISIGFFDTGIDYSHPALSSVYQGGYDFVNEDNDPYDDQGHGTHVAGITASQPIGSNQTISGVAPNVSVYAYKVLNELGEGYISWFLSAFEYAMDPNRDGNLSDHLDIISISAGNPKGTASDLLSSAANQAVQAGIVVVAAAGNNGPSMNSISSPAIAKDVIAVGASVKESQVALYSSRGYLNKSYIKPDIIAPGHQIESTWPNNQYHTLSGTSMATPYITGIIACLL